MGLEALAAKQTIVCGTTPYMNILDKRHIVQDYKGLEKSLAVQVSIEQLERCCQYQSCSHSQELLIQMSLLMAI